MAGAKRKPNSEDKEKDTLLSGDCGRERCSSNTSTSDSDGNSR